MDRVRDLSGSASVCPVSRALRAHLQSSAERMRMRLKQVRNKCHHSLHTNTVMHTLSISLSSKYSKSNIYLHNSYLFSHTIDVTTVQPKKPAGFQKVLFLFVFFICFVT